MQDMREIVIVTIPEDVGEELSSVGEEEEEKAVLVSAELSAQTGYCTHSAQEHSVSSHGPVVQLDG